MEPTTASGTTSETPPTTDDGLTPLVRQRRAQALDAVQPLLAAEGVDVTMDQLAEAAGIGRRTLFRYFPSREELLAAAIRRSYDQLMTDVFDAADPQDEPEVMILAVLERTHDVAERMGRAHWQVAADPESHGELGEAVAARQQARLRYVLRFVQELWRASGRHDEPPRWLVDTFALVESLFAYQGLQRDLGRTTDEIVDTTGRLMIAALREARAAADLES